MNKKYLFEKAKTVAIYGIDGYSGNIYRFFNDIGKKVLFFMNNNNEKFKEINTIDPKDIHKIKELPDIFFIGTGQGKIRPKQKIKNILIDSGISESRIFSSFNMWRYGYDFKKEDYNNNLYSEVAIEIVGTCNAKCPYCGIHSSPKRITKKFLEPYIMEDVLNILAKKGLTTQNPAVSLYNWGEPLMHPEINDIIRILYYKNMPIRLSTNASIMPDFEEPYISNLQEIKVSMSGFTQSSYGRIHGFKLSNILKNIDKLIEMVGNDKIEIIFHVYQFNIKEIEDARNYFINKNLRFTPILVHFGDYNKFISYVNRNMTNIEYDKISKDLMLYYADDFIKFNENYKCIWINSPVLQIDENQNYVTCCTLPKGHKNYSFGNVKNLSRDEVNKLKVSQDVCKECRKTGITFWMNNILGWDDFYINGVFLK